MANSKITDLTADTSPSSSDLLETVKDPGGTPLSRKATLLNVLKGAALGVLTSDGDLFTRTSGALARLTRASLAADSAFSSLYAPALSMGKVYRNASQSAASATEVPISFDTEVRDDASYWAIGNPTRLVIPSTGVYEIEAQVTWANGATTLVAADVRVNGTDYYANAGKVPNSGLNTRIQVSSGALPLNASDYVEIVSFYSAGTSNIVAGLGNTWATIRRLGT